MKKLLSTLLAVTMLLSLAIPATFAEATAGSVLADGTELKVNFADHMDYITPEVTEGEGVSFTTLTGQFSDYVYYNNNAKTGKVTFSVPVTITEAGYYDVSYVGTVSGGTPNSAQHYGDVYYTFYVDNFSSPIYSQIGSSDITAPWTVMENNGSNAADRYFAPGIVYEAQKYTKSVYLTAGEHSFKGLAIAKGGGFRFCADYVSFKKTESPVSDAVDVANDGTATKLSLTAGYNVNLFNFYNYSGANVFTSDDGVKFARYTEESGQTAVPTYRFAVNVPEDGVYALQIKTHLKAGKGANILVNNKVVANIWDMEENAGTSNKLYIATAGEPHEERIYPFYVYLKAGYNTIGGTYIPTDAGALNFAGEYVSIAKADDSLMTKAIPAEGAKVELEDGTYIRNVGSKYYKENDLKYFGKSNSTAYAEDKLYISNTIIDVAAADSYDVEYLLSPKAAGSKIELLLDGEVIGDNTGDGAAMDEYTLASMTKYTTNLDLDAGEHLLQVVVHKNADAGNYTYAFDYVEFKAEETDTPTPPPAPEVTDPKDGELKTYFADHMDYITPEVGEMLKLQGQFGEYAYYNNAAKTGKVRFSVPVTITEAGYYDVSYVGTVSGGTPNSSQQYGDVYYTFYVDNFSSPIYSQIGSSDITAPWTVMENNGSNAADRYFAPGIVYEAQKFTKSVYLTAGEHSFKGLAIAKGGGFRFCADYVSFKKTESPVSDAVDVANDGTATKLSLTTGYNVNLFNFYNYSGANVFTSDDGVKFARYTEESGQTAVPTYRFAVNVPEDGVYALQIKTHLKAGKGANILVNNKVVANIWDMEENAGTSNKLYIATAGEPHEERIYPFYVYLKAGYNTIGGTYIPTDAGALNFAGEYVSIAKADDSLMTKAIPAEGAKVELEDGTYIRNVGSKYYKENDLKYFGKSNSTAYAEDKLYISNTIIDVAAADAYDVEYLLSPKAAGSKIELLLDGEVIGDNTGDGAAMDEYTLASMTKYTTNLDLDAGEHLLQVVVHKNADAGNYTYAFDYVEFKAEETDTPTPPPAPEVTDPKDGELKTYFADHMDYITPEVGEMLKLQGQFGEYAYYNNAAKTGKVRFSVPVTITEAGYYDVSYVGTVSGGTPNSSQQYGDVYYTFYVDNFSSPIYSQIGSSDITAPWTVMENVGSNAADRYFAPGIVYEAQKFTKSVYLTAGEHSFKGLAIAKSGGFRFCADYVSFKKTESPVSDAVDVANDGTVTKLSLTTGYNVNLFNFYNYSGANVFTSDDGVKFARYTQESGQTAVPTYRFAVNVPEDGVYALQIKTHLKAGKGANILVNNEVVANIWDMEENFGTSNKLYIATAGEPHEERIYPFYVYLKAGYNTIGGTYIPTDAGALNFAGEYVSIAKADDSLMTKAIAADGSTIVELEEGTYVRDVGSKYHKENDLKYFGKSGSTAYAEDKLYISNTIIDVAAAGAYNVEYLLSPKAAGSKIELLLDGEVIGDNTGDGVALPEYTLASMSKYATRLDLAAGKHSLQVVVHKNTDTENYTYAFDNINFVPIMEGITTSDGSVSATAFYDSAVTGKAILALYNGSKLVHTAIADVAAEELVTINTTYRGAITSAQLLIWEDLINMVPTVAPKALTIR